MTRGVNIHSGTRLRPAAIAGTTFLSLLIAQSLQAQHANIEWNLLDEYCSDCHNSEDYAGGLAFDLLPKEALLDDADAWELAIRKIKTGMMPPKGKPRPPPRNAR